MFLAALMSAWKCSLHLEQLKYSPPFLSVVEVSSALQTNPALISSFIDVLLLKVEVLVSREVASTVDSVLLLNVLDQIEMYSYHFEPRVLKSNTRFAKEVRWALALRESLRKNQ